MYCQLIFGRISSYDLVNKIFNLQNFHLLEIVRHYKKPTTQKSSFIKKDTIRLSNCMFLYSTKPWKDFEI